MFSREEITATSQQPDDEELEREFEEEAEKHKGEVEEPEEEVFELSSPIKEESVKAGKTDEIFNLDDDNIMENYDSDLEVPEVELKEELKDEKETDSGDIPKKKVKKTPGAMEPGKNTFVKDIDVPLNIDIPDDRDEVLLNLNLRIVVKKK